MLIKVKSFFSFFIFIFLFWINLGYSDLTDYLEPDVIQVLINAQEEGFYTVRLLEGSVDGSNRLVVLLGETHARTTQEKNLGDRILPHFSCIGQECMDYSKTWGGRCLKWCRDTVVFAVKLSQNRTEETTLKDANLKTNLENFTNAIVQVLESYLTFAEQYSPSQLGRLVLHLQEDPSQATSSKKIREISFSLTTGKPEVFSEVLRACDFSLIEILSRKLNRSQLNRLLHKLASHSLVNAELQERLESIAKRFEETRDATEEELIASGPPMNTHTCYETTTQSTAYTFSLEEGHNPALIENIYSLYFPISTAAQVGAVGAWLFGNYLPDSIRYTFYTAAAVTTLPDLLSQRIFGSDQVNPASPIYGLIGGRDQTMAKNIVKTLKKRPQDQTILGIVGKLHVKGIADLLKKYGFAEQPLTLSHGTELIRPTYVDPFLGIKFPPK